MIKVKIHLEVTGEQKDQGKGKIYGNYTQYVNAWSSQRDTYESDHQLCYKRTNTNISPVEHSDKHIFYGCVWDGRGWGKGRGNREVNALCTKRNDRDHPFL